MISFDSSLGIEIRGQSLVFTVVRRGIRGVRGDSSQVIENFLQLEKQAAVEKLQQVRRRSRFNKDNVVLGLPRSRVILRQIELPLEAGENLEQVVRYQVEYLQPSEDSASYFDHIVLQRDEQRGRLVLLVALAPQGFLDPYLERLDAAGIRPSRIEISASALFNLVSLRRDLLVGKDWTVVFDLNEQSSELVLLRGRGEVISRDLALPAEELTVDRLLEELQAFFSQIKEENGAIDRFYFCGTRCQSVFPAFRERFGEAELLSTALHGKLGGSPADASLGFALSPFSAKSMVALNLVPPDRRPRIGWLHYAPAALLAGLFLASLVALGLRGYMQGQDLAGGLEVRLAAIEPQVRDLRKIQGDIEKTKAEINYLDELTRNRTLTLDVLKELTEKMPQESYLQMLTIDMQTKSVDITGYSSSPTAIQNVLLHSPYLQKVENKYTTRDQRVNKDRFNFRAEIRQ